MATIASAAAGNWSATATWTGAVVPGQGDMATLNHVVSLDVNGNVGSIAPAGTGVLVGTNPTFRLLVGVGGRPAFIAKAVVL